MIPADLIDAWLILVRNGLANVRVKVRSLPVARLKRQTVRNRSSQVPH